jgi:hypothetical protein
MSHVYDVNQYYTHSKIIRFCSNTANIVGGIWKSRLTLLASMGQSSVTIIALWDKSNIWQRDVIFRIQKSTQVIKIDGQALEL